MNFSLWKLSYIDLILVLKFLSTMDMDLIGIFKIDKSMYKSMFTKILPAPVQVLVNNFMDTQQFLHPFIAAYGFQLFVSAESQHYFDAQCVF